MDLHSRFGLHVLLSAGFYLRDNVLNETQWLFVALQVVNSSSSGGGFSQLRIEDINHGEKQCLCCHSHLQCNQGKHASCIYGNNCVTGWEKKISGSGYIDSYIVGLKSNKQNTCQSGSGRRMHFEPHSISNAESVLPFTLL